MTAGLVEDLRREIESGRAVVIAGAGVAIAASGGDRRASWVGLLEDALRWCRDHVHGQPGWHDVVETLLRNGDVDSLLLAAETLTTWLGGRGGGDYRRWLHERVGSLPLVDRSLPEALAGLGVPVATTNYDDLIERAAGWGWATWRESARMVRALRGDPRQAPARERTVLHLHGHWDEPASVVLGVRSYQDVLGDEPAQVLQRAMSALRSVVLVGVGEGASDPNLGALRQWLARTFPSVEHRHFRLCLESEVAVLRTAHAPEERITPVPYGGRREDLAGFLRGLTRASPAPPVTVRMSAPVPPDPDPAVRPAERPLTLLHLSDVQFGRSHAFAGSGLTAADQRLDSLFVRLHDDLEELRRREGLAPDLVVVSGDLADRGGAAEFEQAERFLQALAAHTGISRRRIAIVPGDHDVNHSACQAYFHACAADDVDPRAPYWPKWKHFAAMFDRFYAGEPGIAFEMERPWTLFELPELNLVIAGLNSSMAESHRDTDHYGWVGEAQLRWFAERLRALDAPGRLRIGVVHHNVLRGAQHDDENLRDADDLERILGPRLDLLLHGHTHNAGLGRLAGGLVVLSTGSAALARHGRPPEVPNQYQVLRIDAGGIRRWARRYEPGLKRWTGDTRVSDRGDDWRTTIAAGLPMPPG